MEENRDDLPPIIWRFAPWTWSRAGRIGFVVYLCLIFGALTLLMWFVVIVELQLDIPPPLRL